MYQGILDLSQQTPIKCCLPLQNILQISAHIIKLETTGTVRGLKGE